MWDCLYATAIKYGKPCDCLMGKNVDTNKRELVYMEITNENELNAWMD